MTDYKATPEQWDTVQQCADVVGSADCSCVLELRSRVETLEAAAHKHIVETSANILVLASRVEALEAAKRPAPKVYEINKPLQLTPEQTQQITDLLTPNSSAPLSSSNYPEKPDSSFELRIARRPKPPSLKEQSIALLDRIQAAKEGWDISELDTIRRALEQLDD